MTPPGGKEGHAFIRYYDWSVMGSGARGKMDEARLKEHAFRSLRRSGLSVDVKPGETLVTKAWRLLSYRELDDRYYNDIEPAPVAGEFRELALEEVRFDIPGIYRVKVVFHNPPFTFTEQEIQNSVNRAGDGDREGVIEFHKEMNSKRLGNVHSNTIRIEVGP